MEVSGRGWIPEDLLALVVSTDVGGIPEVLPPGMAYLAPPNAKALTAQLLKAI